MQPLTPDRVEARIRAAIDAGRSEDILRWGTRLDTMCPPRPVPALMSSAMWYAHVGLHVFPLAPESKKPRKHSRGFKDARPDVEQVRDWWVTDPEANIGIATGHLVDVIDIDGAVGVKSWARLDDLPPVLGTVCTPRPGGNHLYVRATGSLGNAASLLPGIDYRGIGGYVVAPPSATPQGTYTWSRGLALWD